MRRLSRLCLLGAAAVLGGCLHGPATVDLRYRPGTYVHKLSPARVGVYLFDDERPGWPANAAMRMFEGSDQGRTRMSHTDGDKAMSVFVARALRQELVATGLRVAAEPEFDRLFIYATPASMTAARVDRVIVGRINYFGIVGPPPKSGVSPSAVVLGLTMPVAALPGMVAGEVNRRQLEREGVSFDPDDTPTKAYVDLDLRVVEPDSGKTVWARTTRLKHNAGFLSGAVADTVAAFLAETLALALQQAIWRTDFIAALGATVLPDKVAPPAASPAKAPAAASR